MLNLYLDKLAHSRAGGGKIPHDKIPFNPAVFLKAAFEKLIICVAYDILQKISLLNFNRFQLQPVLAYVRKVFVDTLYPEVYRFRLVVLNKVALVGEQAVLFYIAVLAAVKIDCPKI